MSPANEPDESKELEVPEAETPEPAVEPTPPVTIEDIASLEERRGRRWLMLIVYFLMALAVAILVVFGGRWAYRAITDKDKKPPTTEQPSGSGTQPAPTAPPAAPTPTPTPTPSPSPTTPTPPSSPQTTQLPDNGPGNIAILFVGVALVTGGLHYIYSLRRSTN